MNDVPYSSLRIVISTGPKKIKGTYYHPDIMLYILEWLNPNMMGHMISWINDWKSYTIDNVIEFNATISSLIEDIPNINNNDPERQVQLRIANAIAGSEIEVVCGCGRIDILTDEKIIEVKKYSSLLHALGQILGYGTYYKNKKKTVYTFDVPEENNMEFYRNLFDGYDVDLVIFDD